MAQIEGIVCKVIDYKDSSKILYIYTQEGPISVMARGVKKMTSVMRNLAQVGNFIRFDAPKKELSTLKEATLLDSYESIQYDVEAFTFLSHILELTYNTVDQHNDHPKLISFLKRLLRLINEGANPETASFIFELKLLYFLGYGLHFNTCMTCDSPNVLFSVSDGGHVCKEHAKERSLLFDRDDSALLQALYYIDIDKTDFPVFTKNQVILIRHIIDSLYEEYIGYRSKSRQILKQIKKY
jgi:DNA repair protein RecO (recombination protein O)